MKKVLRMREIVRTTLGVLLAAAISQSTDAATHRVSLALDTDQQAVTGCTIAHPAGAIQGIERVVTAVIDTTSTAAQVTRVEAQTCNGSQLSAPSLILNGPWSAGLANGTSGSAAIEFSLPRDGLPTTGSITGYGLSNDAVGNQDRTAAFSYTFAQASVANALPVPLPSLASAALVLALLALVIATPRLRKHVIAKAGPLLVIASVSISMVLLAATISRDGLVGDWLGVTPVVTDPNGDANGSSDILAVFLQHDAQWLHIRADTRIALVPIASNVAPVVSAGAAQSVTLPNVATLAGSASDDGLPNPPGALNISWSKQSGPGIVGFSAPTSLNTTASFSLPGTYILRLSASDGALSASADVTVSVVSGSNLAPLVNAGSNQSITLPATASLSGTATDDGLPTPASLLTTWSQISGPSNSVVLGNVNSLSTTASFQTTGTFVFRLTASDGALSSTSDVSVTVTNATIALAPIPNQTIPVGQPFKFALAGRTNDARAALVYSLPTAPNGATIEPASNFAWTPSNAQLGVHSVTARVSSANGQNASQTFSITVIRNNRPPSLVETGNTTISQGASFSRTLTATDPDGDALTYRLVNGPSGMNLTGATLTWATGTSAAGDYPVLVQVSDAGGLSDAKRFVISLTPAAAPIARNDSYAVQLGQSLSIPAAQGVLANDVDPAGGALAAAKLSNPAKGTLSGFNPDGSFTYVAPNSIANTFNPVLKKEMVIADDTSEWAWQLADLNGDGHPELLFRLTTGIPGFRGRIRAVDIRNNVMLWETEETPDGCILYSRSNDGGFSFAVADIDDDGIPDVVAPGACYGAEFNAPSDRVFAFNGRTGAFKWKSPVLATAEFSGTGPGTQVSESVALLNRGVSLNITRLRAGEPPSIVVGVAATGVIYRFPGTPQQKLLASCAAIVESVPDGTYSTGEPGSTPHYQNCAGVIVLNGATGAVTQRMIQDAGPRSIVSGNNGIGYLPGVIVADIANSGENKFVFSGAVWNLNGTKYANNLPYQTYSTALGNFDATPDIETVALEQRSDLLTTARLVVRKHDGRELWAMPLPGGWYGQLSVADIDGDGKSDILVPHHDGGGNKVWAIDHRGRVKWNFEASPRPQGSLGATVFSRVAAFDLDGDGIAEVIVQEYNRVLFLNGADGKVKGSVATKGTNTGQWRALTRVVDADNDGRADVVLISSQFGGAACCSPTAVSSVMIFSDAANQWQPSRKIDNQWAYFGANVNDDGSIPSAVPLPNNFATPVTNVWGTQPRVGTPIDPRVVQQDSFTYGANNGALDSAPATVKIDLLPVNRPPKFVSEPPTRYNTNPVSFTVSAIDPDAGDTVTYALLPGASYGATCTVGATSGLVQCQLQGFGSFTVVFSATDSLGAVALQTAVMFESPGAAAVPNVVGLSQATATMAINAANFKLGEVSESFSARPVGEVLTQFPAAGASVLQGEMIALDVSKGMMPVAVPFVVGTSQSIATTRMASAGFSTLVTRVFSNTRPAGEVLSQSVAAGTLFAPGGAPISLTVSAGNGLRLQLNRSIATADQTITVTPLAFDASGAASALPPLTYVITESIPGSLGTLPSVSGNTISMSATTFGSFRITASDAVNGRSASADFVVASPVAAGATTHAQAYVSMVEALDAIYALRPQLVAARAANDVPAMTALVRQMVTTWRTVDIDDVKLSVPVAPPNNFPLSVAELRARGLTPTAADLAVNGILKDAVLDLKAWIAALKTDGTSIAQLDTLADRFNSRAARLDGLQVSAYGGMLNEREYLLIASHLIPELYEAFFNEVGQTVGLAPRNPIFPGLKRASVVQKSTLSEQLVTIAVDKIIEKAMEEVNTRVKNAKQFTVDVLSQAAWTAAAVSSANLLKASVLGGDIYEVVSGASLSFRVFNEPTANWATIEVPGDFDEPLLSSVMIIGPDTVADVSNGIQGLFDALKEGVSYGIDPLQNPKKYRNRDEQKKHLKGLKEKIKAAQGAANTLQDTIENSYQNPDEVLPGCVFTTDPSCAQLYYDGGINPVYRYNPPDGYAGFSGLPVPIIFIVQNQLTGMMYFGTPVFVPAPKK